MYIKLLSFLISKYSTEPTPKVPLEEENQTNYSLLWFDIHAESMGLGAITVVSALVLLLCIGFCLYQCNNCCFCCLIGRRCKKCCHGNHQPDTPSASMDDIDIVDNANNQDFHPDFRAIQRGPVEARRGPKGMILTPTNKKLYPRQKFKTKQRRSIDAKSLRTNHTALPPSYLQGATALDRVSQNSYVVPQPSPDSSRRSVVVDTGVTRPWPMNEAAYSTLTQRGGRHSSASNRENLLVTVPARDAQGRMFGSARLPSTMSLPLQSIYNPPNDRYDQLVPDLSRPNLRPPPGFEQASKGTSPTESLLSINPNKQTNDEDPKK